MRVLRELLEMAGEEDIPVIYDIIKRKLEAGEKIYKDSAQSMSMRPVTGISCTHHDIAAWGNVLINLYWTGPNKMKLEAGYTVNELATWRLTKMDGYWELKT
jgi:hypothetical protein